MSSEPPGGISRSGEFSDLYAYAVEKLMPGFALEAVLFGMLTMALIMAIYTTLRSGVRPLTMRVKQRLARLAAFVFLYVLFTVQWGLSVQHMWDMIFGGWIGYYFVSVGLSAPLTLYPTFGPYILECIVFGMFCALIAFAVYVFANKNWRARPQQVMLAISLLMFTISLSHWALQTHLIAVNFGFRNLAAPSAIDPGLAPLALVSINVVLSDAVVLWRMCVLWRQNAIAYNLAGALFVFTVVLNIANIVKEAKLMNVTVDPVFIQPAYSDSAYGTAALGLSLVSNIVATSLIGWRTWHYRRSILEHLSTFSRHSIAEKVMTLLVESGCVYCVIWVLYIIASKSTAFDTKAVLVQAMQVVDDNGNPTSIAYSNYNLPTPGAAWFNRLMAQLTGIYPTIIIVLVALEQSYLENTFSVPNSTIIFQPGPDSSLRASIQMKRLSRSVGKSAFASSKESDTRLDVNKVTKEKKPNDVEAYPWANAQATESSKIDSLNSPEHQPTPDFLHHLELHAPVPEIARDNIQPFSPQHSYLQLAPHTTSQPPLATAYEPWSDSSDLPLEPNRRPPSTA